MRTVSPRCKRWLFVGIVYVLAMSLLGPVAEAAFHLDRADGSRPLNGLHISGMLTAPQQPLGAPINNFLPKPVYKPRSEPVALPVAAPTGSRWDCIAKYESGNQPLACSPFCGRLQWLPSTWRAAGGTKYADLPQNATWEQEKAIADAWLAQTSWSQWPNTSRRCGLR